MQTDPQVPRPRVAVDPTEQTQRYLRRIGIGLLVASMAVDVGWQQTQKLRIWRRGFEYRLRRQVDPPGPILAAAAISLLEATKSNRARER